MQFPAHVYKSPGNYVQRGKSYRLESVSDDVALKAKIDDGWHLSAAEAFAAAGEAANVVKKRADWRAQKKAAKRKKEFKVAKAKARADKEARASAPVVPVVPTIEPAADENAPPTRAEMTQQAERLGIRVDGRWSDARLLATINEAMAV